jgi:hypothetical protein
MEYTPTLARGHRPRSARVGAKFIEFRLIESEAEAEPCCGPTPCVALIVAL